MSHRQLPNGLVWWIWEKMAGNMQPYNSLVKKGMNIVNLKEKAFCSRDLLERKLSFLFLLMLTKFFAPFFL